MPQLSMLGRPCLSPIWNLGKFGGMQVYDWYDLTAFELLLSISQVVLKQTIE